MALAQQREEIYFGMRSHELANDRNKNFGVALIPNKNTEYLLLANDRLIVISENEQ